MKNIKYLFFILLLLQFSCVKDDTVYDLKELDEITIGDFARIYSIEIGARLKVPANVTTKSGDESTLTYVWYKYNSSQMIADTISYEKDLDVEITDVIPGVETTIMLKVTDSKTGIYARKGSKFITTGIYSGGTMILAKNGSEYDLNFLKSTTDEMRENVYSNTNDGEKLGEKSKMILLPDPDSENPALYKAVIVTCNDNTGGVYLDPNFLKRKNYVSDQFIFPEELPEEINITAYASDAFGDYLFINGKLYPRPNIMAGGGLRPGNGQWYQQLVVLSGPADYYLSNAFSQPHNNYTLMGYPLVYDNLHNRFMINDKRKGNFSFLDNSVITGGHFDFNNMGEGLEMVISGSSNETVDDVWALMRNTITDEYVMIGYVFIYDRQNNTYELRTKYKTTLSRSNYPNLYNGKLLTPGSTSGVENHRPLGPELKGITDFFFFLNDNKVYAFNVGTLAEVPLIDGATDNYTITGIRCQQIPEPTDLDPKASYVRLGIAVKDNTLSTKSAGLVFYRLSSVGGLTANKYYSKTGICDEIIDFKEKID